MERCNLPRITWLKRDQNLASDWPTGYRWVERDADHCLPQVWLLEMNSNPALHTNCEVLKEVIPGVVMETLGELWAIPYHNFSIFFFSISGDPIPLAPKVRLHKPGFPTLHNLHACSKFSVTLPTYIQSLTDPSPLPLFPDMLMSFHPPLAPEALPLQTALSPCHSPASPQTWRLRPAKRACIVRRCCLCCHSVALCSFTMARLQTCGHVWGAHAPLPACLRRLPGPPVRSHPLCCPHVQTGLEHASRCLPEALSHAPPANRGCLTQAVVL